MDEVLSNYTQSIQTNSQVLYTVSGFLHHTVGRFIPSHAIKVRIGSSAIVFLDPQVVLPVGCDPTGAPK